MTSGAPEARADGPRETTLSGYSSASAERETRRRYPWTVEQETPPNQAPFVIGQGASSVASFQVLATRGDAIETQVLTGARGQACVTNQGYFDTIGLKFVVALEESAGGPFTPIATRILPYGGEIAPGATLCRETAFDSPLNPDRTYRIVTTVTIRNYQAHWGTDWGLTLTAPVMLVETSTESDATASLDQTFTCPAGFLCELLADPELLTNTTALTLPVRLSNQGAACGQTFTPASTVVLTATSTGATSQAITPISVFTGTCRPPN
jgi:hypothetical protein